MHKAIALTLYSLGIVSFVLAFRPDGAIFGLAAIALIFGGAFAQLFGAKVEGEES